MIFMGKSIRERLLECKTYDEVKAIKETQSLGVSGHELLKTAFSIQAKQPIIAEQFKNTVIQEMEDEDEEHKKKVQEADGGDSHQASQTDLPFSGEGEQHDAPESASAQPEKKDQMGVAINEMGMPYAGGPQIPPAGGAPPAPGTCGGQHPPMTPQQQMQYTIAETKRIFAPEFKKISEALKALDKKVQETAKIQPKSLDLSDRLGGKGSVSTKPIIQETSSSLKEDLAIKRRNISHMNDLMNSGKY